jgi:hypothetical protein
LGLNRKRKRKQGQLSKATAICSNGSRGSLAISY